MDDAKSCFILFAKQDSNAAARIEQHLREAGIHVSLAEWGDDSGRTVNGLLEEAIADTNLVLILLSPSAVASDFQIQEITASLSREIHARGTNIVPILLEDCTIPAWLANRHPLDMSVNFDDGLERLTSQLKLMPSLELTNLTPQGFEELISDLLTQIKFEPVPLPKGRDVDVDHIAIFRSSDPFGRPTEERWIIETKYSKASRIDPMTIREVAGKLMAAPGYDKALLVTNGIVTSVTREYLEKVNNVNRLPIRLIDGPELNRLLARHPEVVERHIKVGLAS